MDYAIIPFFQTVLDWAFLCVRITCDETPSVCSHILLLFEMLCGIISLKSNGFQYFLWGMETRDKRRQVVFELSFNTSFEVWKQRRFEGVEFCFRGFNTSFEVWKLPTISIEIKAFSTFQYFLWGMETVLCRLWISNVGLPFQYFLWGMETLTRLPIHGKN